jgi:hypothetical protein
LQFQKEQLAKAAALMGQEQAAMRKTSIEIAMPIIRPIVSKS